MAIARLTGQDARGTSTTTSVAATYPGGTTAGNTLIATVYANVASSNVAISGWIKRQPQDFSAGAQGVLIFDKIATGSETTITATGTGASQMRIHIYEYNGLATTITTDGGTGATSATTNVTTIASGNISTANANDLIIAAFGTGGSTSAHSVSNSFTLQQTDSINIRLFDADRIVSSTGSYGTTGSWTTSVRGGVAIAAYQAVSASTKTQTSTARIQAALTKTQTSTANVIGLAANLIDNFDNNTLNTIIWARNSAVQVLNTNGRIETTTTLAANYWDLYTNGYYDLTGSQVSVQLVDAGNQSLASLEVYPVELLKDTNNYVLWLVTGNTIMAYKKVSGTSTQLATASYNSAVHKFFQIRETSGTTYWEYSTTGQSGSWTTLYSVANPIPVTKLLVQIEAGTYATEASTTTAKFDNVNTTANVTKTQTSTARISRVGITKTQTATARISKALTKTQSSTARIAGAPPTAPSGLSGTQSGQYVNLSWTDNSSNETTFILEAKRGGSSNWYMIATPASNATSYTDVTTSYGYTYTYRIKARNADGDSSYATSSSVSLTGSKVFTGKSWGWFFPSATSSPITDYSGSRRFYGLKPEYFTINSSGVAVQLNAPGDGTYAWSTANTASVKKYSQKVFVTVSCGVYANFSALMASSTNKTNSISAFVTFCQTYGFDGIELDYEKYSNWTSGEYTAYKAYLVALGTALHAVGLQLMVDGPPITGSLEQSYYQWLYEDFESIPEVDYVCVMLYDYQYDYGEPSSVQPASWAQDGCKWVRSKISNVNRIVIGIPSYGYHAPVASPYAIITENKVASAARTGYGTATRNSDGEMNWTTGGNFSLYQDSTGLDTKRERIEDEGIVNVSTWHLGGNDTYSAYGEPAMEFYQTSTARIVLGFTKTQTSTARIQVAGTKTQTSISRISKGVTKTQSSTARISKALTKTQTSTASIVSSGTFTKSQTSTARVRATVTKTQTSTARISKAFTSTNTSISRIVKGITKTQTAIARISKTVTKSQTSIASIVAPAIKTKTQLSNARIRKQLTKTQTSTAAIITSALQTPKSGTPVKVVFRSPYIVIDLSAEKVEIDLQAPKAMVALIRPAQTVKLFNPIIDLNLKNPNSTVKES